MSVPSQFRLTVTEAAGQWAAILARQWPRTGGRQERFRPVEVVASLALITLVDPASQGGGDWTRYHPVLQRLSQLCKRSPGSFAEKERNLLGTRPNAARGEPELFLAVVDDPLVIFELWAPVIDGARRAGIGPDLLPDLLDLDGSPTLLGQESLVGDWDRHLADDVAHFLSGGLDPGVSERAAITMARIGQHRFARAVRQAYRNHCGFCGMDASGFAGTRMIVASHIKPWRDSTGRERWDPRNGIAACPSHDAAFDSGLLTVTTDGRIHAAQVLRNASARDRYTAASLTVPLRETVLPSDSDHSPGPRYVAWHNKEIWRNGVGALGAPISDLAADRPEQGYQ